MLSSKGVIAVVVTIQKKCHGSHWLCYKRFNCSVPPFCCGTLQFYELCSLSLQLCVSACVKEDVQQCESEHLRPMDALPAEPEPLPRPGSQGAEASQHGARYVHPLYPVFIHLLIVCPLGFFLRWQTWEGNHLFADEKEATLFLGALDSIFLFSYAMVSGCCALEQTCAWSSAQLGGDMCVVSQGLYLSGVIGDRVNLRYVLCFGLCGSAAVVSGRAAVVSGTSLL